MATRTSSTNPSGIVDVVIVASVPEAALIVSALDAMAQHWEDLAQRETMLSVMAMCRETANTFAKLSADITGQ